MNIPEIIERLQAIGLSAEEAAVYVHLVRQGPSKAADVAAQLDLHRPEAYRVLQGLMQRGYATATLQRPTRFEAAAPTQLFALVFADREAEWERLAGLRDQVVPLLERIQGDDAGLVAKPTYRVLQGREEALAAVERLVSEARASCVLASASPRGNPPPGERAFLDRAWELAVRRAHEGLRVRALVHGDAPLRVPATGLPPALDVRHAEARRAVRFLVRDDAEALLWLATDASSKAAAPGDVVLESDAPEFVGAQAEFFELLWHTSTPLLRPRADPGR